MPDEDYLRFNVDSVDDLLKQKLAPQFPDVGFRGSSANILSEAVASVFSLLIYQVNRSAANSSFSKTNSIAALLNQTKILGYNPVGHQASSMFVDVSVAVNLDAISYSIPRYSFIETSVGRFSISEDQTFSNTVTPDYNVLDDVLVKGGSWVEHQLLYSDGTENQKFILSRGDDIVDHNSIHIYVREPDGEWGMFNQVDSLFLSDGTDKSFEARYNSSGTYDLLFGDGVNGCLMPEDSEIAIYYLSTEAIQSTLSISSFETGFNRFSTDRLNAIILDITSSTSSTYLNSLDGLFNVVNTSANTLKADPETVEEIRRNSPSVFQTQNRLVTSEDYKSFVTNNFSDFVSDVLVLDNTEYLNSYMKYQYDIGVDQPFLESRALYNQINFSDSCNYNNVYLFIIPKAGEYLSGIQKQMIITKMNKTKTLSAQIIPSDPIYLGFGVATPVNAVVPEDLTTSAVEVTKSDNSNRSDDDIRDDVYNTIVTYFSDRQVNFDSSVGISELNSLILTISGVKSIHTTNSTIRNEGLGFYQFNPKYPDQVTVAELSSFFTGIFVPRLVDDNLLNRISIV